MQFYEPKWLELLWFLPLLVLAYRFSVKRKKKLMEAFGEEEAIQKLARSHDPGKVRWKFIFSTLGVFLLVIALAQPQWGKEKKQLKRKGIDLIFVVDTSLSMLAEDIKPSRIEKAKFLMKSFLKHLTGDRVGIVTFAGSGFLQSPLTLDYSAFSLFADSIQVGYIPDPGTNLSDGIQTAVKSLPRDQQKQRAIIVLSDGEAMEGQIEDAVQLAKKENVRLYSLGLGTLEGEPIPLRSSGGRTSGYKKDVQGQVVVTKLNESLLQNLARETGGLYFQASPAEAEVDLIHRHLQSLGKKEFKERVVIERDERFQLFLAIALLILVFETLLGDRRQHVEEPLSF